jgi:hypothetical protein
MPIETPSDLLACLAELTANVLEAWACRVLHIATRIHNLSDPSFDRLRQEHGFGQCRQQRVLVRDPSIEAFGLPRRGKQKLEVEKFLRREDLPLLRHLLQKWARIHQLVE